MARKKGRAEDRQTRASPASAAALLFDRNDVSPDERSVFERFVACLSFYSLSLISLQMNPSIHLFTHLSFFLLLRHAVAQSSERARECIRAV